MDKLVKAKKNEINICYDILDEGRKYQRSQGFEQWTDDYPTLDLVKEDIEKQIGYVLKVDDEIAAYMAITFTEDPFYKDIKGAWSSDDVYCVVHRVAVNPKFRSQGITSTIFKEVEKLCLENNIFYIRIDTHHENKLMQHVFIKNGFKYCGTCYFHGSDKLAYDKILKKTKNLIS